MNKIQARSQVSTDAALANRKMALEKIDSARALLNEAAQLTCPLGNFSRPYKKICKHSDLTKALWHTVNNALLPTYHDEID